MRKTLYVKKFTILTKLKLYDIIKWGDYLM